MSSILEFAVAVANRFPALLVDASIKVTVLMGIAALLILVSRRAGAAVRHLVWSLSLSGALAVPMLSSMLPDWQLLELPGIAARSTTDAIPPLEVRGRTMTVRASDIAVPAAPRASMSSPATGSRNAEVWRSRLVPARGSFWKVPLFMVWMLGATVVLALLAAGSIRMHRLGRTASDVTDRALLDSVHDLRRRLGLRRPIRLLRSPGPIMPMTWGWIRPVVLLPHDASGWPEPRRQAVLLHELAHVKRQDYLLQLIAQITCAVYWFHPLVWIATRCLRCEREQACDDQVLRTGSKPSEYAGHLLDMARALRPAGMRLVPTVAMAAPSQLATRLRAILDADGRRPVLGRRAVWLACVASVAISMPLAAVGPKVPRRDHAARPHPETVGEPTEAVVSPRPHIATRAAATRREAVARTVQDAVAGTVRGAVARSARGVATAVPAVGAETATAVTPAGGRSRRESHSSTHTSSSTSSRTRTETHVEDDGSMTLVASDDDRKIRLEVQGKVQFNADETAVESLSRDGEFELEEHVGKDKRRVEITTEDGALRYKYSLNGDPKPFDAEAQGWMARCLDELFKRTGYGAERRALRRLSTDGVDGLLREASEIGNDYAQRIYLMVALDHGNLDAAALQKVVRLAGQELESDYDQAEFLVRAVENQSFDAKALPAYLAAAASIQSDYDQRRVLTAMLEKQTTLDENSIEAVLRAATEIESSYDLAELLVESLQHLPAGRSPSPGFVRAADTIDSDYDRRRVLSTVLEREPLETSLLISILSSTEKMSSDYDRAELLVQLAETHGIDPALRTAFLSAARGLSSSYDRGRVLDAGAAHGL